MLQVTVYPKTYKLTFEGHAEAGEKGNDLVCAAASGYLYQLAQTLIGENHSEIQCKPYSQYAPTIGVIYQTVLNGFLLLAEGYPDNIHVEISS